MITGAARGIGKAVATACVHHGAVVCVTDTDADALQQSAAQLSSQSPDCLSAVMDIGNQNSVDNLYQKLESSWGVLDVIINNAAMLDISNTRTVTESRWQKVIDINLTGVLRVSQAGLPLLSKSAFPSIINTASTQSFFGQPSSVAYATAKGGLLNLTRCMAIDLGAEGIRVNAVAPGFIDTRMALNPDGNHEHEMPAFKSFYLDQGRIPLRRAGTVEDCSGVFVFLASPLSQYITGQTVIVDGGLSATY